MPTELSAEEAAARLRPADTLGITLGPGQPPAILRALGARQDWSNLRVFGALLAAMVATVTFCSTPSRRMPKTTESPT